MKRLIDNTTWITDRSCCQLREYSSQFIYMCLYHLLMLPTVKDSFMITKQEFLEVKPANWFVERICISDRPKVGLCLKLCDTIIKTAAAISSKYSKIAYLNAFKFSCYDPISSFRSNLLVTYRFTDMGHHRNEKNIFGVKSFPQTKFLYHYQFILIL